MSDSNQTALTQSPGALLVSARERMGLTQEQVAAELKIQLKKIRALESDEFHLMFSEVFARGYLRSYAKLLHIDGEQLVQLYANAHGTQEPVAEVKDSLNLTIRSTPSPWPMRLLLVALILLVWIVAYWYFTDTQSDLSSAVNETDPISPPAQVAELPEPQTYPAEVDADELLPEPSPSAEQATTIEPSAVDTVMPVLDVLELSFAEECWLDVQDANGDVLATDLQSPGSQLTLRGVAPFSVRLGNYAQGVSASVNGEAVDLPERASSDIVTFEMGRARETN
ncbi:MAG TPA: RodZ domain-containing protein [Cellvibrionaceae bacterium]